MSKSLSWNTHGKLYTKVDSSKLLTIMWVGNIINAIFIFFVYLQKAIFWNPIAEKQRLQWRSVGQTTTKLKVFLSQHKLWVKLWKLLTGIPIGRSLKDTRLLNYSELCKQDIGSRCRKKIWSKTWKSLDELQNNIKVINWPYKFMTDRLSILGS